MQFKHHPPGKILLVTASQVPVELTNTQGRELGTRP